MKYVFGKNGNTEFVRVADDSLSLGIHETSTEFPDMVVTHKYIVDGLIKEEGNFKWYSIHEHYKTVDKTRQVDAKFDKANSGLSIAFVTLSENGTIDEVTAAEHPTYFAEWTSGVDYKVGNIRTYGDSIYKCLQAHTSQEGWEPDVAVSLWKKIGDPTVEYPEWSQPVGAGDEYGLGAKVSHNGKHWVSTVGNNVWEPGVYGWDEVHSEE